MTKKDTSIDDLAEVIGQLASAIYEQGAQMNRQFKIMNDHFAVIDGRLDKIEFTLTDMNSRMLAVERQIAELSQKIDAVDSRLIATEADVKELYYMVADLQKYQKSTDKKLSKSYENRLAKIEDFVVKASKQTGIPFVPAK